MKMPKPTWRIGAVVGGIVLAGLLTVLFFALNFYEPVWSRTTGRPWTYIMRDNTWLLPAFLFPVISLAVWRVPFAWWGRILLVGITIGLTLIAEHVFEWV